MMKLEKSLVYFNTSLKGNALVMERLMRQDILKRYPEDTDLLEDVIIENKQAMEMCKGKNPQEVFNSLCQQQGMNPQDIVDKVNK